MKKYIVISATFTAKIIQIKFYNTKFKSISNSNHFHNEYVYLLANKAFLM